MIRSARSFDASMFAVIVAEASPVTCSTAFSTRSSVRFSIRCTAPPTWLTSFWLSSARDWSFSAAEAVAARFICASAIKLCEALCSCFPSRLCANSLSVLSICGDLLTDGCKVDGRPFSSSLTVSSIAIRRYDFSPFTAFVCLLTAAMTSAFVGSDRFDAVELGSVSCCSFLISSRMLIALLLRSVVLVELEDLLCALGGELGRQPGCFLPAELAVVGPAHLVRPAVTLGLCEGDAMLVEYLGESRPVH